MTFAWRLIVKYGSSAALETRHPADNAGLGPSSVYMALCWARFKSLGAGGAVGSTQTFTSQRFIPSAVADLIETYRPAIPSTLPFSPSSPACVQLILCT